MLRLFFLLFLLISPSIFAQEYTNKSPYSIRIASGFADFNDLKDILKFNTHRYEKNLYVINVDAGWRMAKNVFDGPVDIYLKSGFSHFNERGYADDVYEGTLFAKFFVNLDFLQNRMRLGFGEGISYTNDILVVERDDAALNPENATARLLNYLDISVDIDVGRLLKVKSMHDLYLGYVIKHRSGIKGLFSGVHRGSNYLMLSVEKNF